MTAATAPAVFAAPTGPEIERLLGHWTTRCARPVVRGGLRLYHRARHIVWCASGVARLTGAGSACILAANHQSHLDTPAVVGTLPVGIARRLVVAAAADTFAPRRAGFWNDPRRATLTWLLAAGLGAFPFDRGPGARRSLRAAAHLLELGHPLLVYPEGTRSRSGRIGPFKPGVAWLAARSGAAVVPVRVEGGGALLPYYAQRPSPGHVHVRYGAPLRPSVGESHVAFAARIESAVRHLGGPEEAAGGGAARGSGTGKTGPRRGRIAEIEGSRPLPAVRRTVPR